MKVWYLVVIPYHTRLQPGTATGVQVVRPLFTSSPHPRSGGTTKNILIVPGQGLESKIDKVEVSAIWPHTCPPQRLPLCKVRKRVNPLQCSKTYWVLEHTRSAYAAQGS